MIAPGRARRPGAGFRPIPPPDDAELESCPFCAGREERTPPETLTLGDPWRVRVVPNLYPAFERQEVVIHAPHHARSLADLADDQLELVAEAWQRRSVANEGYVHALVNEGREAGGSLAHSHSQLVWLASEPPAVVRESGPVTTRDDAVIVERDGLVLACPAASRVPYEMRIAPAEADDDGFRSDRLGAALRLLGEAVRRVRAIEGPVPLNAWLHNGRHWHLELVPRLTVLAGIELGAGIYVNTLAPEDAAAALRAADATS